MRERRFLIEPVPPGEDRARITGEEHHHLARVLRLRAGDPVSVFDGQGGGYRARLQTVGRSESVVVLEEREEPLSEPGVDLALYQGMLHGERMDWVVEKATEAGASRIVPLLCERSVVRPRSGPWGRLHRWRRIAVSAAKQSGRYRVPRIEEPVSLAGLLGEAGEVEGPPSGRPPALRLILQRGGRPVLDLTGEPAGGAVDLLVGPEGGWSAAERESCREAGWSAVDLGGRTLRAETASVVGVSLVILLMERSPHGKEPF